MADIKQKFGSGNQSITCTLASLANNSAREATVIDNSSNLFLDILIQLKIKSGSSGVSSSGYVNIYAYASADGGTTYSDNCTGSDAGVTLVSPPNLRLVGALNIVANATTYKSVPMSLAAAFGGVLPERVGIVIENKTGAALDSTENNHAKFYQGVYAQAA